MTLGLRLRSTVKGALRPTVRSWRRWRLARSLRSELAASKEEPIRLVVGAGGTTFPGWIATEFALIDVTDARTLERFFGSGSIAAILAEHVWEHMTPEQARSAAANCHRLLRPGGYLRVAVPDGLHPDPAYIEGVKPGGSGPGSDDHKVLYTFRSLQDLLQSAGFEVKLLEWFDERGSFHCLGWEPGEGFVRRSTRFDERNRENPTAYTSIIVDALKRADAPRS
jgi:predicted SAM-dependent methyltransferase